MSAGGTERVATYAKEDKGLASGHSQTKPHIAFPPVWVSNLSAHGIENVILTNLDCSLCGGSHFSLRYDKIPERSREWKKALFWLSVQGSWWPARSGRGYGLLLWQQECQAACSDQEMEKGKCWHSPGFILSSFVLILEHQPMG